MVIWIELTWAILIPLFSNFLRNSTIHFHMFLYLGTCFLRVMVSLVCRLQAVSKMHVPIYSYLISEGRQNCSTLWLAQKNETVTLGNMLPNINICKIGWLNFWENLRIVALKLLELSLLLSQNLSISFTFVSFWGFVVMYTFLYLPHMHSRLIEMSMDGLTVSCSCLIHCQSPIQLLIGPTLIWTSLPPGGSGWIIDWVFG